MKMTTKSNYLLMDCGDGRKLEQWGEFLLDRPAPSARQPRRLGPEIWEAAHAHFSTETEWILNRSIIEEGWDVQVGGLRFRCRLATGGQVGVFPEQAALWERISENLGATPQQANPTKLLSLFAYAGAATLAAIHQPGIKATHLDASRTAVAWAKENAKLNGVPGDKIAWLVEDARRYVQREISRDRRYEAIVLDPPSFGRAPNAESWKIERDLPALIESCARLLSDNSLFLLVSAHTPGWDGTRLANLLDKHLSNLDGHIHSGGLKIEAQSGAVLPAGHWAEWRR